MAAWLSVWLPFVQRASDSVQSVWPTSIAGWLTLILAVFGLVGGIIAYGKQQGRQTSQLNAFGRRVKQLEDNDTKRDAEIRTLHDDVRRVLNAHDGLLKEIARASKTAEQCEELMEKYAIEIGIKIDEWRRTSERWHSDFDRELHGLTVELRVRKLIGEQRHTDDQPRERDR